MTKSLTMSTRRQRLGAGVAAAVAVAATAAFFAGSAGAAPRTLSMIGTFDTPVSGGPGCASPVGLCFQGRFRGTLNGSAGGYVNSLTPTAQAGVVLGDAFAVIHDLRGDLTCAHEQVIINSAPTSTGEFSFLCEITSGTGRYAGATGYLYGTGNAPPGTGEDSGSYSGRITLA